MSNLMYEIIKAKAMSLDFFQQAHCHIQHQGVKGNLNELMLQNLFKEVIPSKYSLTRGIIQDYDGNQSNETDIIIYDSEILPPLLFGDELGFVPAESVTYACEVKTSLNKTELETTISKFQNLKKLKGIKAIGLLFAYKSDLNTKHELKRVSENDSDFLTNPKINILCIFNKSYYFFNSKEIYLKDVVTKDEFLNRHLNNNDQTFKVEGKVINISKGSKVKLNGDLKINGIDYNNLKFYIKSWYGFEVEEDSDDKLEIITLLAGMGNTTSKSTLGKYILPNKKENRLKIYTEVVQDMFGNTSYTNVDFNGYKDVKLNGKYSYNIQLNEDGNNKIEIYPSA